MSIARARVAVDQLNLAGQRQRRAPAFPATATCRARRPSPSRAARGPPASRMRPASKRIIASGAQTAARVSASLIASARAALRQPHARPASCCTRASCCARQLLRQHRLERRRGFGDAAAQHRHVRQAERRARLAIRESPPAACRPRRHRRICRAPRQPSACDTYASA